MVCLNGLDSLVLVTRTLFYINPQRFIVKESDLNLFINDGDILLFQTSNPEEDNIAMIVK